MATRRRSSSYALDDAAASSPGVKVLDFSLAAMLPGLTSDSSSADSTSDSSGTSSVSAVRSRIAAQLAMRLPGQPPMGGAASTGAASTPARPGRGGTSDPGEPLFFESDIAAVTPSLDTSAQKDRIALGAHNARRRPARHQMRGKAPSSSPYAAASATQKASRRAQGTALSNISNKDASSVAAALEKAAAPPPTKPKPAKAAPGPKKAPAITVFEDPDPAKATPVSLASSAPTPRHGILRHTKAAEEEHARNEQWRKEAAHNSALSPDEPDASALVRTRSIRGTGNKQVSINAVKKKKLHKRVTSSLTSLFGRRKSSGSEPSAASSLASSSSSYSDEQPGSQPEAGESFGFGQPADEESHVPPSPLAVSALLNEFGGEMDVDDTENNEDEEEYDEEDHHDDDDDNNSDDDEKMVVSAMPEPSIVITTDTDDVNEEEQFDEVVAAAPPTAATAMTVVTESIASIVVTTTSPSPKASPKTSPAVSPATSSAASAASSAVSTPHASPFASPRASAKSTPVASPMASPRVAHRPLEPSSPARPPPLGLPSALQDALSERHEVVREAISELVDEQCGKEAAFQRNTTPPSALSLSSVDALLEAAAEVDSIELSPVPESPSAGLPGYDAPPTFSDNATPVDSRPPSVPIPSPSSPATTSSPASTARRQASSTERQTQHAGSLAFPSPGKSSTIAGSVRVGATSVALLAQKFGASPEKDEASIPTFLKRSPKRPALAALNESLVEEHGAAASTSPAAVAKSEQPEQAKKQTPVSQPPATSAAVAEPAKSTTKTPLDETEEVARVTNVRSLLNLFQQQSS
eukprot:m.13545 g.13545  ORF g.13545 m.13545 type:complete len:812 (-) comp3311_c0_seq1:1485-3920(-)